MRIAIIVLVVVVVAFVAVLLLAHNGGIKIAGFDPPPIKDGKVDEDKLSDSDWHRPNLATFIANYGGDFAPHAKFGETSPVTIDIDAGASRRVTAQKPDNVDIAKVGIAAGGLLITYDCKHKDDTSCSQTVCLCTPGSALTSTAVALCGHDSQWKQSTSTGVCTNKGRREGTILIYPEQQDVDLTPLGAPVTVTLK